MAFTKLADLDCSTTVTLGGKNKETGKSNPTSLEGYYLGFRKIDSKLNSKGYTLLHVFQTQDGNVGVWGKTHMDTNLANVTPGTMTRVTFIGMVETKKRPMFKYSVEIDADRTIDVGVLASEATGADYEGDDLESYEESSVDSDAAADEVPYTPASAPKTAAKSASAAQQARVQALLNGNRGR